MADTEHVAAARPAAGPPVAPGQAGATGAPPPRPFGTPGAPLRRTPFLFGLTATAGAVLTIGAIGALRQIAGLLTLILAAMFFAIGLHRPVVALRRRMSNRSALLVVCLGTLVVLNGGLALIVPVAVRQGAALVSALPEFISSLADSRAFQRIAQDTDLREWLSNVLTPERLSDLAGGLIGIVGTVLGAVTAAVTVIVLSLFFLTGYDRLRLGAYGMVPASRRERVTLLGDEVLAKIGSYLAGSLMIASVAGVASLTWCLLIGIPYAVLLCLVVAALDLIPQIGATLGAAVVALVALSVSLPTALATIGFFLCYQLLENWVIYPRVMHRAVHISNLAAILSVLVGGGLLGVLGVLIAVPACAAVQLILREVVKPRQDAR